MEKHDWMMEVTLRLVAKCSYHVVLPLVHVGDAQGHKLFGVMCVLDGVVKIGNYCYLQLTVSYVCYRTEKIV
jgi:hypothetical protein